jgi:DNA-binding IscR family transcriptional regulator
VDVIAGIARGFIDGKTVPAPLAAKWAGITLDATQAILDKLTIRGLIHSVRREEGGPEGYTLARPPDKIAIADVLAASYEATDHPLGSPETEGGARLSQQLRDAQMTQVGSTTVAKLLEGRGLGTYEPKSGGWSSGTPGATVPTLGSGAANHESRRNGEGGNGGASAADGDSLRGVLPEGGGGQGPRG